MKIGARGPDAWDTVDVLDIAPLGGRLLRLGLRELLAQGHHSGPPAGVAPARFLYKRNLSRCIGTERDFEVAGMLMPRSPRCCPGRGWLMTPA